MNLFRSGFAGYTRRLLTLRFLLPSLMLAACSGSGVDETRPGNTTNGTVLQAFVAGRTSDYSAGQIKRLSITDGDVLNGEYPATLSDISVATDGTSVYQLGRFGLDSLTRFDLVDTSTPVFQRSVAAAGGDANPYQIVFVNPTKAYVIRYGSTRVWIVDPSATGDEAFKRGELDLTAYADTDGLPEASGGVLVGDRLFVLMERLENFAVTRPGYLAVFDTVTDTEIDTGQDSDGGTLGIPLDISNPTALQYSAQTGQLYVLGRGNFFAADDGAGDRFSGGIVTVDTESFAVVSLLDDGSEAENDGFLSDLLVVSDTRAYLLTYASFGNTTLRQWNPVSGLLEVGAVAGLEGVDITTLAVDPLDRLWVGLNGATPGFQLIDPATNTVLKESVPTALVPINVVFVPMDAG